MGSVLAAPSIEAAVDPETAAEVAGLRHVTDRRPGFARRRAGKGFVYLDREGRPIRDPDVRARIASLAIPPAWTDVWICPDPRGHLQATGRDLRNRKQYRYHPEWLRVRSLANFERLLPFGRALPGVRETVDRDLARRGLAQERVLATVVELLGRTMIRVGNEEYARSNRSYGLTTLRANHVRVEGVAIRFRFDAKGGQAVDQSLRSPRLARIVRRLQELPGQELFAWLDEAGEVREVRSEDVNEYLGRAAGGEFTAKDFRTWGGSALAFHRFRELEPPRTATANRKRVLGVMRDVARVLGNTAAVCRKHYVHPALAEAYAAGWIREVRVPPPSRCPARLVPAEAGLLRFLESARRRRPTTPA